MSTEHEVVRRGPRRTVKRWCEWCGETLRSSRFCNDDCADAYAADLGITIKHPPLKDRPPPPVPRTTR